MPRLGTQLSATQLGSPFDTMSDNPRLGRYEVLRRIASGGMATVYLGRALGEGGFQRLVAVKIMHPHLAEDPEFVAMFLDEARLAASIRHPNVVATLDVQRAPEGLFLVMDYIDGPTLSRMLKVLDRARRPIELGIALRIFLDTLAGLDAAHELIGPNGEPLHLIHRDVSPSNVLVGADGISRITDFGIARAEARITSTRGRQLKGKLPYMAPEQLASNPIDRRVDVYAAGCVLWEMLTLQRLFQGDDEAQLLAGVLQGAKQPPSALRPDVPQAIDMVCMQALGTLENRFPSAAIFAETLEDAARHEGIRIASIRDVGRFVKELNPSAHEPSVGSDPGAGSSSSSSISRMGVSTPQRWQATPPSGARPPSVPQLGATMALPPLTGPGFGPTTGTGVPALHSSPGFNAPSAPLTNPGPPDAFPTTNSSVIAMPITPGIGRHKVMVTLVGALGVAIVGVLIAYLATGDHTGNATPGPMDTVTYEETTTAPDTQTTSTTESTMESTTAPTTEPTTEPSTRPTRRPVVVRPRPETKPPTTSKPPPPPPPPPPTGTEFRPALP